VRIAAIYAPASVSEGGARKAIPRRGKADRFFQQVSKNGARLLRSFAGSSNRRKSKGSKNCPAAKGFAQDVRVPGKRIREGGGVSHASALYAKNGKEPYLNQTRAAKPGMLGGRG